MILTLILAGLAYIGMVQVYRSVQKQYLELKSLWIEIQSFLRARRKERRIITIKIYSHPSSSPPSSSSKHETPMEMADKAVETKFEKASTGAEQTAEEQLFMGVEVDGEAYSLYENITTDELEQMGRVLSVETAPIKEEIAAASTICKLKDSPMLTDLIAITGNRVEELLKNIIISDPKIVKEGFDYSRYITT